MFKYCRSLITAIALVGTWGPLAAQQAGGTKVGVLTCNTSASLGLLVGSHQKLRCSFKPDNGGHLRTMWATSIALDLILASRQAA
jgi:hypothetical protein